MALLVMFKNALANTPSHHNVTLERFCRANVRANFRLTSRKAKLRANVRSFERESCRKRETNFRSNFRSLWTAGQPGLVHGDLHASISCALSLLFKVSWLGPRVLAFILVAARVASSPEPSPISCLLVFSLLRVGYINDAF